MREEFQQVPAKNLLHAISVGLLFKPSANPKRFKSEEHVMPYANAACAKIIEPTLPLPTTDIPVADDHLREILKRCPAPTYQAASRFRQTSDPQHLPPIVFGIIARFVEPDLRAKLIHPPADLRLVEDLGIDSLTMLEIVMLTEEVLTITVRNDELRELRTIGEIQQFIEGKLKKPRAIA